MAPHTHLIESAAGAFSNRSTTFDGFHRAHADAGARNHRRAYDRGVLWVRITLLIVVSALLLCVVGSSKARYASAGPASSPDLQDGR